MKPFLLRDPMQTLESLRGYAIRMAALNECLGIVRPYLSSLSSMSEALPLLASLTAIDEAVLSTSLSQQALGEGRKKVARLGSTFLGTQAVRWRERCVCPACIEDGVLSSIIWEIEACLVCPRHRFYLVDQCNRCNSKLSWEAAALDRCSCGQLLSTLERSHAPRYEVSFSRYLQDSALFSLGKSSLSFKGMHHFEPRVPLDALLLFIEFGYAKLIGAIRISWTESKGERAFLRRVRKTIAESVCGEGVRAAVCERFSRIDGPLFIGRHPFTERDRVELKWMFSGIKPPDIFPLRDQMEGRRQRWQGIAPAMVVVDLSVEDRA